MHQKIHTHQKENTHQNYIMINVSGEILNVVPSTYYKEILLLNTDGINYGSGIYEIYSSGTVLNDQSRKKRKNV
jgi:hypothetical protein